MEISNEEKLAKKIVSFSLKHDINLHCMIYTEILNGASLPALTDEECSRVAYEFPVTLSNIRGCFPKHRTLLNHDELRHLRPLGNKQNEH